MKAMARADYEKAVRDWVAIYNKYLIEHGLADFVITLKK
mgnify:FL=1